MSTSSKAEQFAKRSETKYYYLALGLSILFFIILTYVQYFFTDSFYKPGAWVFFITTPAALLFAVLQLKKFRQSTAARMIYAVAFHIILGLAIIFTAPQNTAYTFLWILLILGVQVNIGRRAVALSYLSLIIVQITTLVYRPNTVLNNVLLSTIEFMLIFVISQLMLTSRKTEEEELKELKSSLNRELFERQRLISLINNMGEAVVATDKKGKILLYNAAVLNLFDTNKSLDGKPLDSVLSLKDTKHKKVKIAPLLKQNPIGLTSRDYVHEFGPNDTINLYLNIAPVKLSFKEESESGYIVLMRDITKEKTLEDERDEFISVVSHELRTPVAIAEGNISNALFMSKNEKNKEIVVDSLEQAHERVLFLANMINDLATLSRAEKTDANIEYTSVNPKELLHAMARDYESEAAAKNLKLTVSAANNLKPIVTSELYLHEILQNFVTNSLKYTKNGSIILHVRSNKSGDAVFSVADTGIGLSKSDQKHVFEKFFRSEDFRTRESSGTGLGLYVTAKLAHKIGARIGLESELNKGTTFTITVPSQKEEVNP